MYLDWTKNAGNYWVCDTEANSLNPTQFWCAVAKNLGTGEVIEFDTEAMYDGRFKSFCSQPNLIFIGHNFISYDAYHLNRLSICNIPIDKIVDSLVLSYLYDPYISGGHSLEAYGERFKSPKLGHEDWSHFSPEMMARCRQDVEINEKTYKGLCQRMAKIGFSEKSCEIEHRIRYVIDKQQRRGFHFNKAGATALIGRIASEVYTLSGQIHTIFPPVLTHIRDYDYRVKKDGKPFSSYQRHIEDYAAVQLSECGTKYGVYNYQDFNIGSPVQRIEKLLSLGWEPDQFTKAGSPQVNEETLTAFAELSGRKEIKAIADWIIRSSRKSMIEGWLKVLGPDDRIHGTIFTCGAQSRRMRHVKPNCVPVSSQALTRNGWKYWYDLKEGEDILAYDMSTRTKKWTPLLKVSYFDEAEIYSFGQNNPGKRLYCTKNHSWVSQPRDSSKYKKEVPEKLVEAQNLRRNSRVRINAIFDNDIKESKFSLIQEKYEKDWVAEICKLSNPELAAIMQGFLLADGCRHNKTWQFAQAEGPLLDAFLTCLYLVSETRISACQKRPLKGPNQRMGYNIVQTYNTFMRTKDMSLKYEGLGPVWCPTTAFGTWVMKQGDFITITGNTANIPKASEKVLYGKECRSLWDTRDKENRCLVGYDASGLEMRGFGHYIGGGKVADLYIYGKPHIVNASNMASYLNMGVDVDQSKKSFYSMIYGAYDKRLGNDLARGGEGLGEKIRHVLLKTTPGLEKATMEAQEEWEYNGGLLQCIDGGYVRCPSKNAALNYKIQPAGAVAMKLTTIKLDKWIEDNDVDSWRVGDIHDEGQLDTNKKVADEVGKQAVKSIEEAGEELGFCVPLTGDYICGSDWSKTH